VAAAVGPGVVAAGCAAGAGVASAGLEAAATFFSIACTVSGPTTPSTIKPALPWKERTACSVLPPNVPSIVPGS